MGQELRLAMRALFRNPGFSSAAVLILALGTGASTAMFSIAYGVLLRDLPFDQPESLVTVLSKMPRLGYPKSYAGAADYFDWRRRQQVFEDLALTRAVGNYNLTGAGEPERLVGARTTASLFSTLRAAPLLGRTFSEVEQQDEGRASVVVLSYGLWQRRFGGDPGIVGRKILLNGMPHLVIGVMRPEFRYPSREFELWTPLYMPPENLRGRLDFSYICVARLRPGVSIEQARAQMDAVAAGLSREYPETNKEVGVYVGPLLGEMTGSVRTSVWVLLGAVGTLFLLGCINLANLLLARATGRSREMSIRVALGATRRRLARQFFLETVPLAALGAALGVVAASWILEILIPLLPATMPRVEEIGLNGPVLLFATVLSTLAAFGVAMAPAAQVSTQIEPAAVRRSRLRDGLLIAQLAGTMLLLVSSGLLMRSFIRLGATDPGFRSERVLSLHFAVNRAKYGDDRGVAAFSVRLLEAVEAVPGVESVGIVNRLPLGGQIQTGIIQFEGHDTQRNSDWRSVSGDYFRTLSIPLLAGRTFDAKDTADRPAVGIIDERMAHEVFGDESPIGKRFRIGMDIPGMPWVEIVGVVGHLRHEGLDRDPRPQVYWPYAQRTQDRMAMVVKTQGDPGSATAAVRSAIQQIDPDQPLYEVRPMDEVVSRALAGDRLNMTLVGIFAALALVLASVGLYGVISQLTTQRWREIGVRMAVGATGTDVLGLVLGSGLSRGLAGIAVGLALSAATTRVFKAMLHGVQPFDAMTYLGAVAVLLAVVLIASYLPARHAVRLEPSAILRSE